MDDFEKNSLASLSSCCLYTRYTNFRNPNTPANNAPDHKTPEVLVMDFSLVLETMDAEPPLKPNTRIAVSRRYQNRSLTRDFRLAPCPNKRPVLRSKYVLTSRSVRLILGLVLSLFCSIEWLQRLFVFGPRTSIDRGGSTIRVTSLGSVRRRSSMIRSSPKETLTMAPCRFKSKSLSE